MLQENERYGALFLPREFLYLRFVMPIQDGSGLLMLDRSIEEKDALAQGKITAVRGNLDWSVAVVKSTADNDYSTLQLHTRVENYGFLLTETQNSELTLAFLRPYYKLQYFISKNL